MNLQVFLLFILVVSVCGSMKGKSAGGKVKRIDVKEAPARKAPVAPMDEPDSDDSDKEEKRLKHRFKDVSKISGVISIGSKHASGAAKGEDNEEDIRSFLPEIDDDEWEVLPNVVMPTLNHPLNEWPGFRTVRGEKVARERVVPTYNFQILLAAKIKANRMYLLSDGLGSKFRDIYDGSTSKFIAKKIFDDIQTRYREYKPPPRISVSRISRFFGGKSSEHEESREDLILKSIKFPQEERDLSYFSLSQEFQKLLFDRYKTPLREDKFLSLDHPDDSYQFIFDVFNVESAPRRDDPGTIPQYMEGRRWINQVVLCELPSQDPHAYNDAEKSVVIEKFESWIKFVTSGEFSPDHLPLVSVKPSSKNSFYVTTKCGTDIPESDICDDVRVDFIRYLNSPIGSASFYCQELAIVGRISKISGSFRCQLRRKLDLEHGEYPVKKCWGCSIM